MKKCRQLGVSWPQVMRKCTLAAGIYAPAVRIKHRHSRGVGKLVVGAAF